MRSAIGLVLLSLLLAGCTATATPVRTVTVTATPVVSQPPSGDSAPWDLHAMCAAESEVQTLIVWRDQQTQAKRLTASQSAAVLQAIAVQYLEFDRRELPAAVQDDVETLMQAAGTLEHPGIDLRASTVERARNVLSQTCSDAGLTIGVVAQGG